MTEEEKDKIIGSMAALADNAEKWIIQQRSAYPTEGAVRRTPINSGWNEDMHLGYIQAMRDAISIVETGE